MIGIRAQLPRSTIKFSDIRDGSSCTYLVGEKYVRPDYYDTGQDPGDNEGVYMGFANNVSRETQEAPSQDTPGYLHYCISARPLRSCFTWRCATARFTRSTTASPCRSISTWATGTTAIRSTRRRFDAPSLRPCLARRHSPAGRRPRARRQTRPATRWCGSRC